MRVKVSYVLKVVNRELYYISKGLNGNTCNCKVKSANHRDNLGAFKVIVNYTNLLFI
jgi:hypothetical protein